MMRPLIIATSTRRTFSTDDATTYGARLVRAVPAAAKSAGVGHAPTLLLIRLALTAMDDDAEPWARLSMEERCEAILHDDDQRGEYAVKRATAVLVKAGLITLLDGGNASGAARYAVHVKAVDKYGEGERSALPKSPRKVSAQRSKGERSALRKVSAQRSPKEEQGEKEEGARVRTTPPATTCSEHPDGNSTTACRGCMDARKARDAQPTVTGIQTIKPNARCEPGGHRLVDDGTCVRCPERADAIAAEPKPSPYIKRREGERHA